MSLIVGSEVGSGRLLQLIEGSVLVVGADVALDLSVDYSAWSSW